MAVMLGFALTFSAGGFVAQVEDRLLRIEAEGKNRKFVPSAEQITFNGECTAQLSQ